jgi:membrane protease YdiL (CAAX protease family)
MCGMPKETYHDLLTYLFREAGFRPARQCYFNYRFLLALLAGIIVVWVMHGWVKPYPAEFKIGLVPLLSLIIWQPLVEEVLFRGIIQGQFTKREWGKRSWLSISGANVAASVLFSTIHLINGSPLFALSVMAPSLVFGYFRDYCNSVYPSIIIHSTYNAMVFAGLILYGNMDFPLL